MKRKMSYLICFVLSMSIIGCKQNNSHKQSFTAIPDQNQASISQVADTNILEYDSLGIAREQQKIKAIHASESCKIETLIKIRNNIDDLSESQVLSFLQSFNEVCALNVEYSEFSNYLLFLLLREQPRLVMKVLTENDSISYKYINKNLTNPINDTINIDIICQKIESVNGYDAAKDRILASIKKTISK